MEEPIKIMLRTSNIRHLFFILRTYLFTYLFIYLSIGFILISCSSNVPIAIEKQDGGPAEEIDLSQVKDAVPKQETWARYGNHSPYYVLGSTYEVMDSNKDFQQDGIASWYGTKFHGELTSTREAYDMYAMTAAHKTLPLPSYVRVTNLENQKQIVVRVNDRGPFKEGRIIDLSYAAAHKLDMHEKGTAKVHIEVLPPFISKPEIALETQDSTVVFREIDFPKHKINYLQIGVFTNETTANELQLSLVRSIANNVIVLKQQNGQTMLYKVRIGPIESYTDLVSIQEVLIKRNLPHYYLVSE